MCGPGQARRQEASTNTLEDDGRGPRPGEATGQVLRLLEKQREPGARLESPCNESLCEGSSPGQGQTVRQR